MQIFFISVDDKVTGITNTLVVSLKTHKNKNVFFFQIKFMFYNLEIENSHPILTPLLDFFIVHFITHCTAYLKIYVIEVSFWHRGKCQ